MRGHVQAYVEFDCDWCPRERWANVVTSAPYAVVGADLLRCAPYKLHGPVPCSVMCSPPPQEAAKLLFHVDRQHARRVPRKHSAGACGPHTCAWKMTGAVRYGCSSKQPVTWHVHVAGQQRKSLCASLHGHRLRSVALQRSITQRAAAGAPWAGAQTSGPLLPALPQ